jgi:DNA repair exonuclease SbcCD nuclease subunit
MKIAILGDTHFGMRADSIPFHEHYKEYYTNHFFPALKEHGVTLVVQLGDLFDRRKYISFQSLSLAREYFFDVLQKEGITLYTLLGNHDITFRNTLSINSPSLLLKDYPNVRVFDEPTNLEDIGVDIIPWICRDNEQSIMDFIKSSKNRVCFGHFELAGYEMDKGNFCLEGMDPKLLEKYELVLSGHFHHKSSRNNITYVGTPGEMTWNDYDSERGFHIFDTDTLELEFFQNPLSMFHKIYYRDDELTYNEVVEADYSHLTGKYVKLIVENKENQIVFDAMIDSITKAAPTELSVVEDFSILSDSNSEIDQAEDTMTILDKYVDGLTTDIKTDKIKSILREVYNEALQMELND